MSLTADYIHFKKRHLLIQWLINIDRRGFRNLAHNMPFWLIPKPTNSIHIQLPNQLLMLIDPVKDKGVERSLYYTGTYEMGTLDVIQNYLSEGGVFVDVGANIGLMSVCAAIEVGPEGKVIAFEPHAETRKIAEHNIEINGLEDIIEVIPKGAGSKKETKPLFDNWDVNRGAASFVKGSKENVGDEIEITTIDEVLANQSVDVMKIDVEGFELEALKGAKNTLQRKNPPLLIVECTEETEHQEFTRLELFNFISQTQPRYQCYKLKGTKLRRSSLVKVNSKNDLPTHDNLIWMPK